MQTETATPQEPSAAPAPAVIIFGRDEKGKPHASRFSADDAELAEKAAGLMGMRVLKVADADLVTLADRLPAGRVFASGRGFVPFVRGEVFASLEAAAGGAEPTPLSLNGGTSGPSKAKGGRSATKAADTAENQPEAASEPAKPARDWGSIGEGSLVLACEGEMAGWFESIVTAAKVDDLFELRWRDWPHLPVIVRRREDLALLHPAYSADTSA